MRLLPEVVRAAKSMPEKQFVAELNQRHDQHLSVKQPVVMATPDDVCSRFETGHCSDSHTGRGMHHAG